VLQLQNDAPIRGKPHLWSDAKIPAALREPLADYKKLVASGTTG
jgi:hypothetical protein